MAEGHRERYRDRFENENIDSIPEYAVLEKLLHGIIVRKDTSELARELIREFGSFAGVIDASREELEKVKGIGPSVSAYIKSVPELFSRYCRSRETDGEEFPEILRATEFLHLSSRVRKFEALLVMCLDGKKKILSCKIVSRTPETFDTDGVEMVVNYAVNSNATAILVAHNYIDRKSRELDFDYRLLKEIYNALKPVNIQCADYIIVDGEKYTSFSSLGRMPKIDM